MDEVDLSRLLGRVTSALECAKDTENDLFRMHTTLISVLKKYGDRQTSIVDEPEDDAVDAIESVRVIEAVVEDDSMLSSENDSDLPRLVGHQDKTARLPDSDDEVDVDGVDCRPSSLEVHKMREQKRQQENILKKHAGLSRFAALNRSTTSTCTAKETHPEVSDESSDESYRTPSSSHCDLLSVESNPPVIAEEEVQIETEPNTVSVSTDCDTPETPVNTSGDVEITEVITRVGQMMVDVIERQVPPLDLPRASTPIRQDSPPKSRDWISSNDLEPFTLIPAQTSPRIEPSPWSYNRTVSTPVRSQTTPVDTPFKGYETLPAPSNLEPDCPMCGLVFTQDHDLSYRNFHANSCIDSLG